MIEQLDPGSAPAAMELRRQSRLRSDAIGFTRVLPLALIAAVAIWACVDDEIPTETQRTQPGSSLFDASVGDAQGSLCPEGEPKVGDNCPSSEDTQIRCTYNIGVCTWQGSTYDITLDFCCQRGVVWSMCGTNVTPCDRENNDAGTGSAID